MRFNSRLEPANVKTQCQYKIRPVIAEAGTNLKDYAV